MSEDEKKPVTICLHYEGKMMKINTDSLQPLSSIKDKIYVFWRIGRKQQHLYSDGQELTGDDKTLWNVALENVENVGKPSVLKTLDKLTNWKITLKTEFKAAEPVDIPNNKQIPWEMQKVIHALNKNRKAIFALATKERISEDNKDASTMVFCAKHDKWDEVFKILERKPYIVNAIPQERAWSVLHQAVYKNNTEVVSRLLALKTCDPEIKAKRDWDNHGEAGMTPYQLAEKYKCSCITLLSDHAKQNAINLGTTFVPAVKGETFLQSSLSYFNVACSFLKRDVLTSLNLEDCNFLHITEKMFQLLEKDWEYVQATVIECLYPFDKMSADHLQTATSTDDLKEAMIWIYTCPRVYKQVNTALRRASEAEFPVSDDLLLSLYSLFLASILLHWKNLESVQETLYRGIALPADQAKLYCKGTTFYWPSFTSSSMQQKTAYKFTRYGKGDVHAVFVVDNSKKSIWSPRNITAFAQSGSEEEVVYPPCAKFCVTDVKQMSEYTEYSLELLHPDK